jgi:very-short-patch-repair endonuclease
MSRFSRTREKTARARELRVNATPAEKVLWAYLRSAQLGASFRRQHPIGPFFADFCCPALKLVIELDGGQHAERVDYDEARTAYLAAQGYDVIRFWNSDVKDGLDAVCEQITWSVRRRKFEMGEGG